MLIPLNSLLIVLSFGAWLCVLFLPSAVYEIDLLT